MDKAFAPYRQRVIDACRNPDDGTSFSAEEKGGMAFVNFGPQTRIPVPATLICGGAARGGTTILSFLLTLFGQEMGDPEGSEDMSFIDARFDPEALKTLIALRNSQHQTWGVKIPGMSSGQYQFFDETCRNPVYIYLYRNPLSVALSTIRHAPEHEMYPANRRGLVTSLNASESSYIQFTQFLAVTNSPVILIAMEEMKRNPRRIIRRLIKALRIEVSEDRFEAVCGLILEGGYKNISELPPLPPNLPKSPA